MKRILLSAVAILSLAITHSYAQTQSGAAVNPYAAKFGTGAGSIAAGDWLQNEIARAESAESTNANAASAAQTTANAAIPATRLLGSYTGPLDQIAKPMLKTICTIGDSWDAHFSQFPNASPGSTSTSYIIGQESWAQQIYRKTGAFYIPLANQFGWGGDGTAISAAYPGILQRLRTILASGPSQCQHADAWIYNGGTNDIYFFLSGQTAFSPTSSEANIQAAGNLIMATGSTFMVNGIPPRGDAYEQTTATAAAAGEAYRTQVNRATQAWCATQQRCVFFPLDSTLGGQNVLTGTVSAYSAGQINFTTSAGPVSRGALNGWTIYGPTPVASDQISASSAASIGTLDTALSFAAGSAFTAAQSGTPNKSMYWVDLLHTGQSGAEAMGDLYMSILGAQLQPTLPSCTSLNDAWSVSNPTGAISTNCSMLSTGGTITADGSGTASGTLPYGWTSLGGHTSTGTDTFSILSGVTALGGGNAVQMVVARTANSGTINEKHAVYQNVSFSSGHWASGDKVHAECMMMLASGESNVNSLYLQMAFPSTAAGTTSDAIDGGSSAALTYPYHNSIRDGQWLRYRTPSVEIGGGASVVGSASGTVLTVTSVTDPMGDIAVGQTIYVSGVSTGVTIASLGSGTGGVGTYNLSGSLTDPAGTAFTLVGLLSSGSLQISAILAVNPAPDLIGTGSISTAGVLTVSASTFGYVFPGEQVTAAGLTGTYTVMPYLTNSTTGVGGLGTYQLSASPSTAIASESIDIGGTVSATVDIGGCAIYKDPPGTLTLNWGDVRRFAANDRSAGLRKVA